MPPASPGWVALLVLGMQQYLIPYWFIYRKFWCSVPRGLWLHTGGCWRVFRRCVTAHISFIIEESFTQWCPLWLQISTSVRCTQESASMADAWTQMGPIGVNVPVASLSTEMERHASVSLRSLYFQILMNIHQAFSSVDADECASGTACGNGTCINTVGGFECTCNHGFTPGMGGVCEGGWS